ncbi:MAG: hypothetical protein M0R17_02665 [Candidatus Omnitrophica bacterium]|jgi:hypothetical protein|nr:hypothetical protein [Candidatus Omnitrophota bacterium]
MKTFRGDIIEFYHRLKNNIPFSFTRFSDGCEAILKNYKLEINNNQVIFGDTIFNKGFPSIDHKCFDPNKHQHIRHLLLDSFYYQADNYYKGKICKCCVGNERYNWMLNELKDHSNLTWANLLVNNNYDFFIDVIVPLFKSKEVILICNENSLILPVESKSIHKLPFKTSAIFHVGENCIVNDIDLIEDLKDFTGQDSQNRVYLFSASSLSNILIHQLHQFNNKNTYLNIGTTLNYYLNLPIDRDYLLAKWKYKQPYGLSHRVCI